MILRHTSKQIHKLKKREMTLREELTQLAIALRHENAELTAKVLDHLDMNDVDQNALVGGILQLQKANQAHDKTQLETLRSEGESFLKKMNRGSS